MLDIIGLKTNFHKKFLVFNLNYPDTGGYKLRTMNFLLTFCFFPLHYKINHRKQEKT